MPCNNTRWYTADGREMLLHEMHDKHLRNAANFLERKVDELQVLAAHAHTFLLSLQATQRRLEQLYREQHRRWGVEHRTIEPEYHVVREKERAKRRASTSNINTGEKGTGGEEATAGVVASDNAQNRATVVGRGALTGGRVTTRPACQRQRQPQDQSRQLRKP